MYKSSTLEALATLSQETRLDVYRLLIQAGANGMLAGEISDALKVRQNTMSTNLSILSQSGLLLPRQREGRAIRYFADMNGVRGFLAFLMEDYCGGRPNRCQPLIDDNRLQLLRPARLS